MLHRSFAGLRAGLLAGAAAMAWTGAGAWAQAGPKTEAAPFAEQSRAASPEREFERPATGGLGLRDLAMMERVSDPRISPDGRRVLYSVHETNWDENKGENALWIAALDGSAQARRLAVSEGGAGHGRWSADGNAIYFLSSRGGSNQVWRADREGNAAAQVTALPVDVSAFRVLPDGTGLLISLSVFADCEALECTRDRLKARSDNPSSIRVYDRLPLRPWDTWRDGRVTHLFHQPLDASGLGGGDPRDLTPGYEGSIGGGDAAYALTRDGHVIASSQPDSAESPFSSNSDLWRIPLAGGEPVNLTADNPAGDANPAVSPDGLSLAWLAFSRDGLSGDQPRIMVSGVDGSNARRIAADWDRGASDLSWSSDGRSLLSTAADLGQNRLYAIDVRTGQARDLTGDGAVGAYAERAGRVVYAHDSFVSPAQLLVTDLAGGARRPLTRHNEAALGGLDLPEPEYFTFEGWNGAPVQGWVFRPAGYEPGRRYPAVKLIHGGPKSPWTNAWSYRWNPQVYTGAGYAVVMVNFHGSPGFGQAFTDSINEHWGDRPLEDIRRGWEHAAAAYDFIDADRACALGASYGGYMVNMIAGRWSEPWRCLVNHAGVFDVPQLMNAMDIGTFISEFGGPTWERLELYQAHNPATYAGDWDKPMLVLHGSRDFRVPVEQSLATFSALQRQGIPSRFVHAPDENHWILRPRNWADWQQEILDWTAEWTGS